jgi:hypothetical protein
MTPDPLDDQELDTFAFAIETAVGHVTEYRRVEGGGQTYDDRRIGRMIANEDVLARLGPRVVDELRRMRADIDAAWEATTIAGSVRGFGVTLAEIISSAREDRAELRAEVAVLRVTLEAIRTALNKEPAP